MADENTFKKISNTWAELCTDNENLSEEIGEMQRDIEIIDPSNGAKLEKILKNDPHNKGNSIKTSNALGPLDPSIIEFRLKTDHSNEDKSNEVACQESSLKRKHIEATIQLNDEENVKKSRADSFSSSSSTSSILSIQKFEKDPEILARRQKQIDFGKNTIGYDNYIAKVPKSSRSKDHPKTPPMYHKFSRRAWDGLIKKWRIQLHEYDPKSRNNETLEEGEILDDSQVKNNN